MAVEIPVPEDSRDAGERILADFNEIDRSVADFKLESIRNKFPQIVSDAEMVVGTFDEDFPDGYIGYPDDGGTLPEQLGYAGDFYDITGEPHEWVPEEEARTPHRDFYRGVFAKYFKPFIEWQSLHRNEDAKANPEAYRMGLFYEAYDIIRSQTPYPADIEADSDKIPQQVT